MKDKIHESLNKFSDSIYAIVFVFIVRESFDEINKDGSSISQLTPALFLVAGLFYFLLWDWVLGRMLTIRNPYQSYTRFFLEILIASFAYGTASAAIKGNSFFLLYFALVLFFGAIWATRTEHQIEFKRDLPELCVIRTLQYIGAGVTVIAFFCWRVIGTTMGWSMVVPVFINLWCFILFYEMFVPRFRGILAGPGVPFIARPNVRKLRKALRSITG